MLKQKHCLESNNNKINIRITKIKFSEVTNEVIEKKNLANPYPHCPKIIFYSDDKLAFKDRTNATSTSSSVISNKKKNVVIRDRNKEGEVINVVKEKQKTEASSASFAKQKI